MSKGGHSWYYRWFDFCRMWRKVGLAMKDPRDFQARLAERERHLARAPNLVSWYDATTIAQLVAYAQWELDEAQDALNPSAELRGDPEDTFHAGCCVMRAGAALARLRREFG